MSVLCLVELDKDAVIDASLRAVGFARTLCAGGESPVAVVSGSPGALATPGPFAIGQLGDLGVERLYVIKLDRGYAPVLIARGLAEITKAASATAVLAAATDHGNEILAHLGAMADLEFVANCTAAEKTPGGLSIHRQRWGGSLLEEALLVSPVALLSVATDVAAPQPASSSTVPETLAVTAGPAAGDQVVEATERREEVVGVTLSNAKIVVSGGRGMGGAEAFASIEQLARLLGGAVGVSRAVTSLGWRPHAEQVGQTGTKVTPDLYLACGISGAIQHLAGCQSAKHMVAINTDPDAPIMSRADYAIIGDVNEVVPALIEAIAARGQTGGSKA
ncbi:MAG: electron transfer flavoprotein subunit alpha/FixB family protein [Acidimicrobiales bacterium]